MKGGNYPITVWKLFRILRDAFSSSYRNFSDGFCNRDARLTSNNPQWMRQFAVVRRSAANRAAMGRFPWLGFSDVAPQ